MNSEEANIKRPYQMAYASEVKINLLETVIPGPYSHPCYNEEPEREPHHRLETSQRESGPCISRLWG